MFYGYVRTSVHVFACVRMCLWPRVLHLYICSFICIHNVRTSTYPVNIPFHQYMCKSMTVALTAEFAAHALHVQRSTFHLYCICFPAVEYECRFKMPKKRPTYWFVRI